MANAFISSFTELTFLNTTARSGVIIMPSTNIPGRILTFKDRAGTLFNSTITFSTASATQFFENNTRQLTFNDPFGAYSFATGTDNKWYTIGGSYMDTAVISSITTINSVAMSISSGSIVASTLQIRDSISQSTNTLFLRSTNLFYSSPTHFFIVGPTKAPKPLLMRVPGQFQPNQITGLNLWLDAADVNTVVIQNGLVSQWNDKSGNARNLATVLSNAGTITYSQYGGVPSILFNSTYTLNLNGAYMRVVSPVNLTNLTVFSLVRSRTATNNQNGLLAVPASGFEYSSTDAFGHFIDSATPQDRFYANGSGTPVQNAVVSSGGDAFPLRISAFTCTSAGVLSSWGNGTAGQITSGGARGGTATGFGIGFDINMPGGSPVNLTCVSQFSECLVYNIVLTTTQRQQVEGYLAWKWNLVALLPSTHPYKNSPP